MSINLVFMQIPLVGEISGAMQGHPEAQQTVAREHAQETLKNEQSQVQKLERQDASQEVQPDGKQAGGQHHGGGRGRQRKRPPEESPPDTKESPWAGNIVNRRV